MAPRGPNRKSLSRRRNRRSPSRTAGNGRSPRSRPSSDPSATTHFPRPVRTGIYGIRWYFMGVNGFLGFETRFNDVGGKGCAQCAGRGCRPGHKALELLDIAAHSASPMACSRPDLRASAEKHRTGDAPGLRRASVREPGWGRFCTWNRCCGSRSAPDAWHPRTASLRTNRQVRCASFISLLASRMVLALARQVAATARKCPNRNTRSESAACALSRPQDASRASSSRTMRNSPAMTRAIPSIFPLVRRSPKTKCEVTEIPTSADDVTTA